MVCSGALYYWIVLFLGEVPKDEGDGLQHFAIAKECWNQQELFLSHWGKPLFTLVSSVFAQFGFYGYVSFNILVFIASSLLAFKILEHYQTPKIICFLFPWILITIPDYSNSIVGGMTEPFFGLMLLALFILVLKEKWFWFAFIASFTPFARSEGMLVVVAAVPYLLLLRKWRFIPVLFCGFLLYCIVGWVLLDQPLWYFENNPYSPLSIYGSGPWLTYLYSVFDHLGLIAILFIPVSLFGLLVWRGKGSKSDLLHILFFAGIYIGIILIHSYLWANGLRGALGLSRLATLGLLPFLVIEFIALGYVLRELHTMVHAFVALCLGALIFREINQLELPSKATIQQLTLKKISVYLNKNKEQARKIYYFHPLIGYFLGINSRTQNNQFTHRYIHLQEDANNFFKPGDLIVRDSKFGALEQGLPLEELENYPWIIPVKHLYIPHYYVEASGESQSVIVYEVMDKRTFNRASWEKNRKVIEKKITKKTVQTTGKVTSQYLSIDSVLTLPKLYGPRQELICTYTLESKGIKPIHLIFNSTSGYYVSLPLDPSKHEIMMPFVAGNMEGVLFIHNPSQQPFELNFTQKSWRQTLDSNIEPVK